MYHEVHGAGPPLVLLHGGLSTIDASFSKVLPAFAKTRLVIAPEQQGHGRTADADRPLSYEQMADDTAALLAHLNVASADFLGWSDGANVALALAMRHPGRVRSLTLVGASVDNVDALGAEILKWLESARPEDFQPEAREYAAVAPEPAHWPAFVAKWKRLQLEFKGVPAEAMKAIKAPVLVMAGDRGGDRPEHAATILRRFAPAQAQLAVLPGTTHFAIRERPEWMLSMVNAFLDASAPKAPADRKPAASKPGAGTVRSKDGTEIAFDESGQGPPVVLVSGALSTRAMNSGLAAALAKRFTVIHFDRRGRGASGDTAPYAVDREVEDIEALIDRVGGKACLYGISSGAVLALEAAAKLPAKVRKLALYEPPFIVDASRPRVPPEFTARIGELVSAGRRGDAVELFMVEGVGVPAEMVGRMKSAPMWAAMEKLAHTLVYDGLVVGDTQAGKPLPADRWASATSTTLVLDGGKSDAWLRNAARALAEILPNATRRTLEGQTHAVAAGPMAAALIEFFED